MRSPGQFEHRAIAHAKARVVSASMCNGRRAGTQRHARSEEHRTPRSPTPIVPSNDFGFLRMWSIYPAQIQPIVDAMKPNFDEVEHCGEHPA